MSRDTVIVYGPQGCGKSRNADKMRRAFGLDSVIRDAKPGDNPPVTGALVLTHSPDVHLIADGTIAAIDYDAAMRYVHKRRRKRLH